MPVIIKQNKNQYPVHNTSTFNSYVGTLKVKQNGQEYIVEDKEIIVEPDIGYSEYFDIIYYSISIDDKDTSDIFYYSQLAGKNVNLYANTTISRIYEGNPQITPQYRKATVTLKCEVELFDGGYETFEIDSVMSSNLEEDETEDLQLSGSFNVPYGVTRLIIKLDI